MILEWVDAGVGSLNNLGGKGSLAPSPPNNIRAGARVAQSHVLRCYSDMGCPPESLSPKEALQELRTKSSYYDSVRTDIQAYSEDLVSWPDAGSVPISSGDNVHPAACDMLDD